MERLLALLEPSLLWLTLHALQVLNVYIHPSRPSADQIENQIVGHRITVLNQNGILHVMCHNIGYQFCISIGLDTEGPRWASRDLMLTEEGQDKSRRSQCSAFLVFVILGAIGMVGHTFHDDHWPSHSVGRV